MMLKGDVGVTFTRRGRRRSGSSHCSNDSGPSPSMKMRCAAAVSKAGTAASTKKWRAPQSPTMVASCCGEEWVESGATATPARRPPRNTAAYSSELAAQMATVWPGFRPSRCKEAAMRSTIASSWPQVTLRWPCTNAVCRGRAAACLAMRSAIAWNGGRALGVGGVGGVDV